MMTYPDITGLEQIIQYRQPHYHKDFPLILFWSHKSGCTSLLKWFFFQIGILDKALKYNPWVHWYELEVYKKQKNYNAEVIEQILNSQKGVLKLVRDPYKRAVTSFMHLITHMDTFYTAEAGEIKDLFYKDSNSNKGISFKQFLYYLKNKGANVYLTDQHLAPQYIEGEELLVRNYIHLENFSNHISEIEKSHGLAKSPLETIIKSEHHFSSKMALTGDHSETIFTNCNGQLPTYQSFYDKEVKDLVKDIFKKDFEVYGYKKH